MHPGRMESALFTGLTLHCPVRVADTIPIFLRLVMAHNFEPGPFRLTPWLRPLINIVAIMWMIFIMVRACSL